jgi:hypothetical protein
MDGINFDGDVDEQGVKTQKFPQFPDRKVKTQKFPQFPKWKVKTQKFPHT